MKRRWVPTDNFYVPNALIGLGMLHTCSAARQVVLKAYNMMPDPRSDLAHQLYFNAEADTLYFEAQHDLMDFLVLKSRNVQRGFRRVAVGIDQIHGISSLAEKSTKYHTDFQKTGMRC
jgi:hypothetical protein